MNAMTNVIIKPLLTEKSSVMTDKLGYYCFQVDKKATKNDVKKAVETFFNVKVRKVTTSVLPGKVKRSGRGFKKTSSSKKAYVQIGEGQKIELFKGI